MISIMRTWVGCLCTLITLRGATFADTTWNYYEYGPSVWGKYYPICAGIRQSPINLIRSESKYNRKFKIQLHDYDNIVAGSITNIGYTVNFVLNMPENSTEPSLFVSIGDGQYDGTYYLRSMHFLVPSNHLDEYVSNEVEMVLMHMNTKGFIGMSFPVTTCRADMRGFLPHQLKDALAGLTEVGNSVDFEFNPASMLDVDEGKLAECGFYSYPGSLTWPPCTENVFWLVRQRSVCTTPRMNSYILICAELTDGGVISAEKLQITVKLPATLLLMAAFHNLTDVTGRRLQNSRPVQPLKDRELLYHPC